MHRKCCTAWASLRRIAFLARFRPIIPEFYRKLLTLGGKYDIYISFSHNPVRKVEPEKKERGAPCSTSTSMTSPSSLPPSPIPSSPPRWRRRAVTPTPTSSLLMMSWAPSNAPGGGGGPTRSVASLGGRT